MYDMEYAGLDYEDKDSRILRAKGRYLYPAFFAEESEQREELFAVAREKGMEALYYIFCNYSMEMDSIYYGVMKMDIEQQKVGYRFFKEESYQEYLLARLKEENKALLEEFQQFEEDALEDEDLDDFYEKVGEFMDKEMRLNFQEFVKGMEYQTLLNL